MAKPKYVVYYNSLFERKEIARLNTEEEAANMCYKHNKSIGKWFDAGIGTLSFIHDE